LHNEELCNFNSSPNILITVHKRRRTRWAISRACTEDMRNTYPILIEEPEGQILFPGSWLNGRIILILIL